MNGAAAPFDGLAADYDRTFTASTIGQLMRAAVWRRIDAVFQPGDRVLELNCGTGEDAVRLGARGVKARRVPHDLIERELRTQQEGAEALLETVAGGQGRAGIAR